MVQKLHRFSRNCAKITDFAPVFPVLIFAKTALTLYIQAFTLFRQAVRMFFFLGNKVVQIQYS